MKNLFAVMMMILLFAACEKEELADPSVNGVANGNTQLAVETAVTVRDRVVERTMVKVWKQ